MCDCACCACGCSCGFMSVSGVCYYSVCACACCDQSMLVCVLINAFQSMCDCVLAPCIDLWHAWPGPIINAKEVRVPVHQLPASGAFAARSSTIAEELVKPLSYGTGHDAARSSHSQCLGVSGPDAPRSTASPLF